MSGRPTLIPCIGCGARVPDVDGPTHRYIGASPGCWALHGEVMAREYGDARFSGGQLTVDAYAAQHPGTPSPQSIQSVAVHLVSLHLQLERGYASRQAVDAIRRATGHKQAFAWLDPPPSPGALTIVDVHLVDDPAAYAEAVRRWARSVWQAWAPHHATVLRWAALVTPSP